MQNGEMQLTKKIQGNIVSVLKHVIEWTVSKNTGARFEQRTNFILKWEKFERQIGFNIGEVCITINTHTMI